MDDVVGATWKANASQPVNRHALVMCLGYTLWRRMCSGELEKATVCAMLPALSSIVYGVWPGKGVNRVFVQGHWNTSTSCDGSLITYHTHCRYAIFNRVPFSDATIHIIRVQHRICQNHQSSATDGRH